MDRIVEWLLQGDVSLQYLTHLMLPGSGPETLEPLRRRIETEGFGARIISRRNPGGHWDIWFYQRKWTCTHYTLTDLKNLGISSACAPCREMVQRAFDECQLPDGGINFSKTLVQSDVCVDGMILNYAAYFCPEDSRSEALAGHILSMQNDNGDFGWDLVRRVSDVHTTICVLEGFLSYKNAGFTCHIDRIAEAEKRAIEYLLSNWLFSQDDRRYRQLSYPYRYRYDLLRALEYFTRAGLAYDPRMAPALDWLIGRRSKDGLWPLQNRHKGREHLIYEELGEPSRFLTLKALYILKKYGPDAI